jgi:hypothetical protein
MDYTKMTDEQLVEIIESRYGNALKKWKDDDPAVIEFFKRISIGE